MTIFTRIVLNPIKSISSSIQGGIQKKRSFNKSCVIIFFAIGSVRITTLSVCSSVGTYIRCKNLACCASITPWKRPQCYPPPSLKKYISYKKKSCFKSAQKLNTTVFFVPVIYGLEEGGGGDWVDGLDVSLGYENVRRKD